MGLFKRGSVWWMSFTYKGRYYRKSTETENQKLAQRIYDKVKGQIAEGKWFDRTLSESKTFTELMDMFRKYSRKNCKSLAYLSSANALEKFFGPYILSEITPRLWKQYKEEREADGMKPATINRDLAAFKRAFNLACSEEYGWLDSSPVASVKHEKGETRRDRWITKEEEDIFLFHCP